jgi:ATP-dependent DNA helicase RecG
VTAEWKPTGFASLDPLDLLAFAGGSAASPRVSALAAGLGLRGAKEKQGAEALGLRCVGDLIEHLPHRHEDRGDVKLINELKIGEDATVAVEVRSIDTHRSFGRRTVVRTVATVADESGPLEVTWFNQPWVTRQVGVGSQLILHGRFEGKGRFRAVEHEIGSGVGSLTKGLVPVHPAADGLSAKRIRKLVAAHRGAIAHVVDPLPASVIASERLPARAAALDAIHFPTSAEAEEEARRRLAFDELFLQQLGLLRRRAGREAIGTAPRVVGGASLTDRWLGGLPFEPTGDQRRAITAVTDDMALDRPMTRLLMGEVGSGKTVVAVHAMLRAVECGWQALLMAPTETLANQHMRSVERLLDGLPIPFALLTGSTSPQRRREIVAKLETGELQMVIGTHALIEADVKAPKLAVCVVDEQHRFGVRQRELLAASGPEGSNPHVLHMTATPIPRTLALAAYGDLEASTLKELPAGRSPIATHIVSGERARARAYERIREEVADGGRAFVVCPLVEASESIESTAATDERDRLAAGPLNGLRVALLHGRMSAAEKDDVMVAFANGDSDVLVSTTVIEVGVDVPEATVMLVENAERFGLAQLHQLRGRVGRGGRGGVCLLSGPADARRLIAMAETTDGFKLAELDLELRGEGELTGLRQSGLATLKAASLPSDLPLLERAHVAAASLLEQEPLLDGPLGSLAAILLADEGPVPDDRIAA